MRTSPRDSCSELTQLQSQLHRNSNRQSRLTACNISIYASCDAATISPDPVPGRAGSGGLFCAGSDLDRRQEDDQGQKEQSWASGQVRRGPIMACMGHVCLPCSHAVPMLTSVHSPQSRRRCAAYLGLSDVSEDISLILTADPGDFSGVSEAFFILDNLRDRRDVPRRQTVCGDVSSGEIMGQPAVVVTTGEASGSTDRKG